MIVIFRCNNYTTVTFFKRVSPPLLDILFEVFMHAAIQCLGFASVNPSEVGGWRTECIEVWMKPDWFDLIVVKSEWWVNGDSLYYQSLLSHMFEIFQNKTRSKISNAEGSNQGSSSSLPKSPILPDDILGCFSPCFPQCLLGYSMLMPAERHTASAPAVGIWTKISSWPQMASQFPQSDPVSIFFSKHLIPGYGSNKTNRDCLAGPLWSRYFPFWRCQPSEYAASKSSKITAK